MNKSSIFLLVLISLIGGFLRLNTAQASGFIYTRTPTGNSVPSPLSFRIQGVFGIDFCGDPTKTSYAVGVSGDSFYEAPRMYHAQGEAVDETSQLNLPIGSYYSIVMNCYGSSGSSWSFLEGTYGSAILFTVVTSPSITTTSLFDATVNTAYSQTLQATGGTTPFTWSIVTGLGNLPAGLSLNPITGEISGTPTTVQTANFTVRITDNNNQTATKNLSITVHGNTPSGSNVQVTSGSTMLTFSNVTQEGQTTVTQSSSGSQPPSGFKLGNPPTYYSISTTAQFTGQVEVCLTWTQGQFNNENNLKLFHYDGTNWTNITESGYPDTVNNVICGLTTSFSDFAIFEKKQVMATIDIKPGSYPNSINLGSNGVVPVAIFSTSTFNATTIDPITVTLASAPVKLKGNGTTMSSFQDVNNDGLMDLVVQVSTETLQLSSTDQTADLVGYTSDNTEVIGSDTVRVVQ